MENTTMGTVFFFFFNPFCKYIQLDVKMGSVPRLNIQMSGFMIMWHNKDEDNPYSQVEKNPAKIHM